MNIELVGIYKLPKKKKDVIATAHVYLVDYNIDIRGIKLLQRGKAIFIQLPHFRAFDVETKKPVSYPLFRFTDDNQHKNFITKLKELLKTPL